MSKLQKYYEKVYKAPIYISIDCSETEYLAFLKSKNIDLDIHGSVARTTACRSEDGNIEYFIWVADTKNLETLVHEVIHLTGFILKDRGYHYDAENDEPFCYLAEHLFKVIINKKV